MKKSILLAALISVYGLTAYAKDEGVNCNGNGSCGQTYNTTNNTTNAGGTGIGVGVGIGGNSNSTSSATGGNSNVDVRNTNINGNANSNTNKNEINSNNAQLQGQAQKQSTNNANNSTNSVVVEGDNFEARRIPVNTAFAPSIAPTANCALSVSAGVSVIGFSGSFGKAYIDQNCADNEDIRNVALVLGDKQTAEQMKCEISEPYRKARASLGRPCAGYKAANADGTKTVLYSEWAKENYSVNANPLTK
jgi:hypothetical protein